MKTYLRIFLPLLSIAMPCPVHPAEASLQHSRLLTTTFPGLNSLLRDTEEKLKAVLTTEEMIPFYDLAHFITDYNRNRSNRALPPYREIGNKVAAVKKTLQQTKHLPSQKKVALQAINFTETQLIKAAKLIEKSSLDLLLSYLLQRPYSNSLDAPRPGPTPFFPYVLDVANKIKISFGPHMSRQENAQLDSLIASLRRPLESLRYRSLYQETKNLCSVMKESPINAPEKQDEILRTSLFVEWPGFINIKKLPPSRVFPFLQHCIKVAVTTLEDNLELFIPHPESIPALVKWRKYDKAVKEAFTWSFGISFPFWATLAISAKCHPAIILPLSSLAAGITSAVAGGITSAAIKPPAAEDADKNYPEKI